jgi:hypothetical protein
MLSSGLVSPRLYSDSLCRGNMYGGCAIALIIVEMALLGPYRVGSVRPRPMITVSGVNHLSFPSEAESRTYLD